MAKRTLTTATAKPATPKRPSNPGAIDLIMGARLARQLGISSVTLWRWRKMADFPAARQIRQHVYFSQAEVAAWINRQQAAA
jgi:predicted DNA-binding transcriptional regulator AlpA